MPSLYHWHDEVMVQLEMRELYNEIEQIRLLQDATQARPGWLAQQYAKFGNWLAGIGAAIYQRHSAPIPQYYQSTSFRFSR